MKKILILFSLCLIPLLLNPIYAANSLQNTTLKGQSATLTLDFEFGQDEIKVMRTKIIATPTLDSLIMTFYGDEIDLSDSRLKVYANGKAFSVANVELGIIIYAKYQEEIDNYTINVYFATNEGFKKQVVTTAFELSDDKVVETEIKEKQQYIPELIISSDHDFKTYWKENFNIDVQAYDAKINPSGTGFEGRVNGVDITVIISLGDETITTLKGVTQNGEWLGEYYIQDNITQAGEYTIDILATFNDQSISKSSTMFIIGEVPSDSNGGP